MSIELARSTTLQVTNDLTLSGGFVTVNQLNDFDDEITPNLEDSSSYSTNGWGSSEPTMNDWSVTATYFNQVVAGVRDPGQEMIRARRGKFGDAARIGVRWGNNQGQPEAYQGVAIVQTKRANTGVKNLAATTATLTGTDVALQDIGTTNPFDPAAPAVAPVVSAAAPSGAAAGSIVTINGGGFTGATGVKFGATTASDFAVLSDSTIVAVMPAGSAGAANITVINSTGTSNALVYTRGA